MGTPKKGSYYAAESPAEKRKHKFNKEKGKTLLRQDNIDRYVPYPPQGHAQARVDMEVMRTLVFGNLSFKSLDDKSFLQTTIMRFDSKARVKSREWGRTVGLDRFWRECKRHVDLQLAKDLESTPSVCFTSDMWKASNGMMYCALTIHYVDTSMAAKMFNIEFQVWTTTETAVEICRFLQDAIRRIATDNYHNTHLPELEAEQQAAEEVQVEEVQEEDDVFNPNVTKPVSPFIFPGVNQEVYIVTDNAANMLAGVKMAKKIHPDTDVINPNGVITESFGCVAHLLQLCLKSAFEKEDSKAGSKRPRSTTANPTDELVRDAVNQAKLFTKKINKSTAAAHILRTEATASHGND